MTKTNVIDLKGFVRNDFTFTPIKESDIIIINLAGINAARNFFVFIFESADVPLIRNDGVKGKQYKINSTEKFFFLILSKVHLYLLSFIFFSSLFPPTFFINKNNRKDPMQLPIHEYMYPKKKPKTLTFIIANPTKGNMGINASNIGKNIPINGPPCSTNFKSKSVYSIFTPLF